MLARITPEQFDQWVAWLRVEEELHPDPWPRLFAMLRLGLAAIASALAGAAISPDELDPLKPKPRPWLQRARSKPTPRHDPDQYVSPQAAANWAKVMIPGSAPAAKENTGERS